LNLLADIEFAEKQQVLEAIDRVLEGREGDEKMSLLVSQIISEIEGCLDDPEKIPSIVWRFVDRVGEIVPEMKYKKLDVDLLTPEIVTVLEQSLGKNFDEILIESKEGRDITYLFEMEGVHYGEKLKNLCIRLASKQIKKKSAPQGLKILLKIKNREPLESNVIDFYSDDIILDWAKTWGPTKIASESTASTEDIILKTAGLSETTKFKLILKRVARRYNLTVGEAKEYLVYISKNYTSEKALIEVTKNTKNKNDSFEIIKKIDPNKIRQIPVQSPQIIQGTQESFCKLLGKVAYKVGLSRPATREYLALLSEGYPEKDALVIAKEKGEKDIYSIESLTIFSKKIGAGNLRRMYTSNTSNIQIGGQKMTYPSLLKAISAKYEGLTLSQAREFLALLAEGHSGKVSLEKAKNWKEFDICSEESLKSISTSLGADKIRSTLTTSNEEIEIKKQTIPFYKLFSRIAERKDLTGTEAREYLALIAEKNSEEVAIKKCKEKIDFYAPEVLRTWAKSWGAKKIRNMLVKSKTEITLKIGERTELTNFNYLLNKLWRDKKLILSESREYLALLAEDCSEEDAMKIANKISDPRKEKEKQNQKLIDIEKLLEESEEGSTVRGKELKFLRKLLGDSNLKDLLYLHDKSFQGIPVEQVKSKISEHLGNTYSTLGFGGIDGIEEAPLPKELPPSLKKILIEVLKSDALAFYNKQKKSGSTQEDTDIIMNYLMEKDAVFMKLGHSYLQDVMQEALGYYVSLFENLKKPDHMVEQVKDGRLFPDINQLINVQETKDKGRMLIADEMGMGKSASAIMTKEMLRLGTALVVVPSNVVSTWEEYLSDEVREERGEKKQIGYFQPGHAPTVLTIESIDDLKNGDFASYDYVIMSHNLLKDSYLELLKECNFDHLIIDEVHKVKNVEHGQWSKYVLELSDKIEGEGKYMTLLSGTPIPNKVKDIAILLKLLHPDKFRHTDPKRLTRQIIEGDVINLRALLVDHMQMKELQESINLPNMEEILCYLQLSEEEAEFYEALLEEEDELPPTEKITLLRKFLLNPSSIDTTPNIEGAKIKRINEELESFFQGKDKLVGFVNDYVQDILEGDNSLVEKLKIPTSVNRYVIHGDISKKERKEIQRKLNETDERMFVVVSGKTADVGVDFSGAEEAWQINQPWTKSDERQQIGRVYRPGLKQDIKVKTFIVEGSLENAIRQYIEEKDRVIKKLLNGVDLSELEKRMLRKDENIMESKDFEINPELAKEYLSVTQRLNRMFGTTKKQGEEHFVKFSDIHGDDYAECYRKLGRRSYEANNARVSAHLLQKMVKERNQDPENLKILDIASGPEMLRRHSRELKNSVYSMDILEQHFAESDPENVSVGSYLDIPKEDKSMDYCNLGLAFHHMKLHFKHQSYEPVQAFMEMNRILKTGGRAMISFIHSMELRDFNKFEKLMQELGFQIVQKYSGHASHKGTYETEFITLEKVQDVSFNKEEEDLEETVEILGHDLVKGFHWNNKNNGERKTSARKDIITSFSFNGEYLDIDLNEDDQEVLQEEEDIVALSKDLKKKYKRIENIPDEEILGNNFIRYRVKSGCYRLFRKLKGKNGAIIMK